MNIPTVGSLRHRLMIQSLTNSTDSQGGQSTVWANLIEVWGHLEPRAATEVRFSDAIQYRRTHVAWLRYRAETPYTTSMRISFDSRTFQIKGIRRPDERKFFLLLDLEENVGT